MAFRFRPPRNRERPTEPPPAFRDGPARLDYRDQRDDRPLEVRLTPAEWAWAIALGLVAFVAQVAVTVALIGGAVYLAGYWER